MVISAGGLHSFCYYYHYCCFCFLFRHFRVNIIKFITILVIRSGANDALVLFVESQLRVNVENSFTQISCIT